MATSSRKPTAEQPSGQAYAYCAVKPTTRVALPGGLQPERERAIIVGRSKWVNGTVLHYYFFDRDTDGTQVPAGDGTTTFVSWVGAADQRQVVRDSFATWKELGIGLDFVEVDDRREAEVRIGFMPDDGSWSYVGRDVLGIGVNDRTMNFGWSLTEDSYGVTTALHEIGHTIGMPHEHQNPFAGIVWDEDAVYSYLGGPPNNWSRETTFHNVLRKLDRAEVSGSTWDPDSIMEYAFPAGLIKEPASYADGIRPPGTLSVMDKHYVATWFPPLQSRLPSLKAFQSVPLELTPKQQADFRISPEATRTYKVGTFGASDVVMVLFEKVDGDLRYVSGDDDSGEDRNALLELKLFTGREYVVRVRCYYSWKSATTALMYW